MKYTVQGRSGKLRFVENCPKLFQALVVIAQKQLTLIEQDNRKFFLALLSNTCNKAQNRMTKRADRKRQLYVALEVLS